MSKVYFTSDLHFGHRNIGKYRADIGLDSEQKNRDAICREWAGRITKRDVVWVLGDCCFKEDVIKDLYNLQGRKRLILGNHDVKNIVAFTSAFDKICGIQSYKGYWLTHAPVHSDELRGKKNIHGHVHMEDLNDSRYINVCCDWLYSNTGSFFCDFEVIKIR